MHRFIPVIAFALVFFSGSLDATAATPPRTFPAVVIDGGQSRYTGEPISLSLKDADIKNVLKSFAKLTGLNIVLDPGVQGTVTLELHDVPWDQAFELILKVNRLGYSLEGNLVRIAAPSSLIRPGPQALQ